MEASASLRRSILPVTGFTFTAPRREEAMAAGVEVEVNGDEPREQVITRT